MFTPPPSPMPVPAPPPAEQSSTPPPISLSTSENPPEYPFPRMTSPKSPSTAESGPSRIPLEGKKRTGKRTLVLVSLLPVALIISASLRHFIHLPVPSVLDEPVSVPLVKRDPQLLTALSGTPTLTLSTDSASSSSSQSNTPSPTSALPTIPSTAILPTPFPEAFDASVTDNFTTQGCQDFFANFTQDENFRQCRSFSFLLNTSAAFLQAQRNLTLLNNIIWGTCNTVPTSQTCDSRMSSYLTQFNSICSKDIDAENPVALQAQIGFQSHTAMRAAACLSDPSTNAYCYVDAAAAIPPGDLYFYALPLGTPVPNTTKASCSPCLKSVLAVYAQFTNPSHSGAGAVQIGASSSNSSTTVQGTPLPVLSKTYPAAARLAVDQCGGTYASVGVAQPNGAEYRRYAWAMLLSALFVFASWIL